MAGDLSEEQARENARVKEIRDKLFDVIQECADGDEYEDRDMTRALVEVAVLTALAVFDSIDTAGRYVYDMTDAIVNDIKGVKPH